MSHAEHAETDANEAPAGGAPADPPVDRSRLRLPDLFDEALSALTERIGRSALTAVGTVLGVATLIAVLGLTQTATSQISSQFDAAASREVTVTAQDSTSGDKTDQTPPFPADADQRAMRLNGVQAAGLMWSPATEGNPVMAGAVIPGRDTQTLPLVAATPGYLTAVGAVTSTGRVYDTFADDTAQPVVVLGSSAASALGITDLSSQPNIFINDQAFTVVGILSDAARAPNLLLSVVVPGGTAAARWGEPSASDGITMLVVTQVGAGAQVAEELPLALRPDAPSTLIATPPPDPRGLRESVNTELSGLFLVLAIICLLVGAVSIANTTLVSVMERIPEIGVRRSLGATVGHIVAQILAESGMLGIVGGVLGASVGVLAVVGFCLIRTWTPVIDPLLILAAPGMGLVVGLVAGLYPAIRAGRIEPVDALRR